MRYSKSVKDGGDTGVFELKIALLRAQAACAVLSCHTVKRADRQQAFHDLRATFKEIAKNTREV